MIMVRLLCSVLVTATAVLRRNTRLNAMMSTIKSADLAWIDLEVAPNELRLSNTLNIGQCFNWKKLTPPSDSNGPSDSIWIGDIYGMPIALQEHPHTTKAAVLTASPSKEQMNHIKSILNEYFQLEYSMGELYKLWAQKCARMKIISQCLPGLRVLRQDPWQCLISFICSSNNNISRITLILDRLRRRYGEYHCTVRYDSSCGDFVISFDDENNNEILTSPSKKTKKRSASKMEASATIQSAIADSNTEEEPQIGVDRVDLFSFPTVESLLSASEEELRELGAGYRAKFLRGTAQVIMSKNSNNGDWLRDLRTIQSSTTTTTTSRLLVQNALLECPGVGRKVADCVALFSLDQSDAVPVDTHVWAITTRDYATQLQRRLQTDKASAAAAKSLTPTVYEAIGDVFRELFQEKAGWAHCLLFASELAVHRQRLPKEMQDEMLHFSAQQKALNAQQKLAKKALKEQQLTKKED